MSDGPLLLVIIIVLLKVVAFVCAAAALPITLFGVLTRKLCELKIQSREASSSLHFLLWLPRYIIVTGFIPFFLAECALIAYGIFVGTGDSRLAIGLAFVILVVNIIGIVWTKRNQFLASILPQPELLGDNGFFKNLLSAQIDLLAFICFMITICLLVRIPFLIHLLLNDQVRRSRKTLRTHIFLQFVMTFVDLFISVPFSLLLVFFPWRWRHNLHRLRKSSQQWEVVRVHYKIKLRFFILLEFLNGVVDLFILPLAIILLLTPWRILMLRNKIVALRPPKNSINKWRRKYMRQVLKAVVDLMCMLLGVFVVATLYRLPTMIMGLYRMKGTNDRRGVPALQFVYILLDLLTIITLPFLLITGYRIPKVVIRCRRSWGFVYAIDARIGYNAEHPPTYEHPEPNAQKGLLKQFGHFVVDLPFILMGIIVLALIWRSFFLIRDLKNATTAGERRRRVAYHFGHLFVDIIDLPFALASLIMMVTIWRIYPFYKGAKNLTGQPRSAYRIFVLKQFAEWLLDIPAALGAVLVLITVYRAKYMIRGLKEIWRSSSGGGSNNNQQQIAGGGVGMVPPLAAPPAVPSLEDEELPRPRAQDSMKFMSWHRVVGRQVGLLLLDLPFPVLLLLTLWRLPFCVKRLLNECNTGMERRVMVLRHLWWVIKDIPCSFLVLIMVVLLWRIPSLINAVKNYRRGDDEHQVILEMFGNTLLDIPFVIMGLATLVLPYRAFFLLKSLYNVKEDRSDWQKRIIATEYFFVCFGDFLIFSVGVLMLGTVWRAPSYVSYLYYHATRTDTEGKWKHTRAILEGSMTCFGNWLLDIFSFTQIICILITIVHVPSLVIRTYRVCKQRRGVLGTSLDSAIKAHHHNRSYAAGDSGGSYSSGHMIDFYFCLVSAREEEGERFYPVSLSFIRPLVKFEFIDSLRFLPHVLLIPLKLAGVIFLPLHVYISFRLKKLHRLDQWKALIVSQRPLERRGAGSLAAQRADAARQLAREQYEERIEQLQRLIAYYEDDLRQRNERAASARARGEGDGDGEGEGQGDSNGGGGLGVGGDVSRPSSSRSIPSSLAPSSADEQLSPRTSSTPSSSRPSSSSANAGARVSQSRPSSSSGGYLDPSSAGVIGGGGGQNSPLTRSTSSSQNPSTPHQSVIDSVFVDAPSFDQQQQTSRSSGGASSSRSDGGDQQEAPELTRSRSYNFPRGASNMSLASVTASGTGTGTGTGAGAVTSITGEDDLVLPHHVPDPAVAPAPRSSLSTSDLHSLTTSTNNNNGGGSNNSSNAEQQQAVALRALRHHHLSVSHASINDLDLILSSGGGGGDQQAGGGGLQSSLSASNLHRFSLQQQQAGEGAPPPPPPPPLLVATMIYRPNLLPKCVPLSTKGAP
eukprot:TRINITY_DN2486_c0_g1_i5.p1 TRINITY_DN2486_c0_g1~~TRINITY_DN2486_c0_g1_i5.p1  ORF type:complete len:1371 (+),score=209.37 TRINITY_DN2486_c0_g1_i5:152-4264(+)